MLWIGVTFNYSPLAKLSYLARAAHGAKEYTASWEDAENPTATKQEENVLIEKEE